MKNALKRIAVLLITIILGIVSFMPVDAQASSKITLKNGQEMPNIIYVGDSYTLKVNGTEVRFFSKNKSIATIGLKTGELKAIAIGTVEVIARSVKSGRVVAKKEFVVKQRSTSIATEVSTLHLSKGDTAKIKGILEPANSTDVLNFYSSDDNVATVDRESGEVTARAEGVATITVYAMAEEDSDYTSSDSNSAKVTVYVGNYIDSVQQIEVNKFEVTFNSDVSKLSLKASDFVVNGKTSKKVYPVSSIEFNEKENKVMLTTYANFRDGAVYTVFYKDKSTEFVASDGKVAKLEVSPTVISCEDETPIYIKEYDANGVLLNRFPLKTTDDYECTIIVNEGYYEKNVLCLFNINSYATVNVKYHTKVYNESMQSIDLSTGDVKITGISKDDTVTQGLTYTIADNDNAAQFETKDYKQNTIIAEGDKSRYLYFYILNRVGSEYSKYDDYQVTSTNPDVLKLSGDLTKMNKKIEIKDAKVGTTDIVITNKATQKVVKTIPITVVAKRKASTISIEKTAYTAKISKEKKESETFTIHILDQYGVEMKQQDGILMTQIKLSSVNKVKNGCSLEQCISINGNKVTIFNTESPEATYTYKVQYQKLDPVKFTVTYKK